MTNPRTAFPITLCFFIFSGFAHSSSLNVETDYRLRGISFTNTDFDEKTSTDTLSYYSQRMSLLISGKFSEGIEIGTKLSAIGIAGSTNTPFALPYPRTDFTPFIENAFLKINGFSDLPIDLIIGKQPITYGDGLIICDNGTGFDALRISGKYKIPLPFLNLILPVDGDIFTAKVKENFVPNSDQTLYGGVGAITIRKQRIEFGYFEESDFSGTKYNQGPANSFDTRKIFKQYYDFRVGSKEDISSYQFEIVKQYGSIRRSDNTEIKLDGLGYTARGELIGEKTKLGKVSARAMISVFSGDDDPIAFDDDQSFSPTFTRKFDGAERAGYGELFSATPAESFFTLPSIYSGIDTLNVGASFSPIYAWTLGVDYFLYSASQGPKGAPTSSGFERLFGAEFALGIEMDLFVEFVHSKYVSARLSYNRYTPPRFEVYWPKMNPASRYQLEISAKF